MIISCIIIAHTWFGEVKKEYVTGKLVNAGSIYYTIQTPQGLQKHLRMNCAKVK